MFQIRFLSDFRVHSYPSPYQRKKSSWKRRLSRRRQAERRDLRDGRVHGKGRRQNTGRCAHQAPWGPGPVGDVALCLTQLLSEHWYSFWIVSSQNGEFNVPKLFRLSLTTRSTPSLRAKIIPSAVSEIGSMAPNSRRRAPETRVSHYVSTFEEGGHGLLAKKLDSFRGELFRHSPVWNVVVY